MQSSMGITVLYLFVVINQPDHEPDAIYYAEGKQQEGCRADAPISKTIEPVANPITYSAARVYLVRNGSKAPGTPRGSRLNGPFRMVKRDTVRSAANIATPAMMPLMPGNTARS